MPNSIYARTEMQHIFDAIPILKPFEEHVPAPKRLVPRHEPVAEALTSIVVGQMISVKAADTIFKRMQQRAGEHHVWRLTEEQLFECGASRSKARTIAAMGRAYDKDPQRFENWRHQPANEVAKDLKSLWGMGDWSLAMLLLFHFGHGDVWPHSDGGVVRALDKLKFYCKHHQLDWQFDAERAAPHRSYLALYLWSLLGSQVLG